MSLGTIAVYTLHFNYYAFLSELMLITHSSDQYIRLIADIAVQQGIPAPACVIISLVSPVVRVCLLFDFTSMK